MCQVHTRSAEAQRANDQGSQQINQPRLQTHGRAIQQPANRTSKQVPEACRKTVLSMPAPRVQTKFVLVHRRTSRHDDTRTQQMRHGDEAQQQRTIEEAGTGQRRRPETG